MGKKQPRDSYQGDKKRTYLEPKHKITWLFVLNTKRVSNHELRNLALQPIQQPNMVFEKLVKNIQVDLFYFRAPRKRQILCRSPKKLSNKPKTQKRKSDKKAFIQKKKSNINKENIVYTQDY